jgi:hypothetical protein
VRFWLSHYSKRGKKNFDLAVFGVRVAALLIDFLITDCADYTGKFAIVKEYSLGRIAKQEKR